MKLVHVQCTTSKNIADHHALIYSLSLLNLLVGGVFFYPQTPAEPINRAPGGWVTLCGTVCTRGVKGNVSAPSWGIKIKIRQRGWPHFFLVVNTLKDSEPGVGPYVALALYTNLS